MRIISIALKKPVRLFHSYCDFFRKAKVGEELSRLRYSRVVDSRGVGIFAAMQY